MSYRLPIAAAVVCSTAAALAVATAPSPARAEAPARERATQVHCVGGASSCTATVSIAGGASNERVVVRLPGTSMRLTSVRPSNRNLRGAYAISDQGMRDHGHRYAFTLNAAEAPRGSAVRLTFRKPGTHAPMIVRCNGGAACRARVPLVGGASNRLVVVQLPRTDLGLVSVVPSSRTLRGAYSMSRQHLRPGDSEFAFVLNAADGAPRGSHLTLAFARP